MGGGEGGGGEVGGGEVGGGKGGGEKGVGWGIQMASGSAAICQTVEDGCYSLSSYLVSQQLSQHGQPLPLTVYSACAHHIRLGVDNLLMDGWAGRPGGMGSEWGRRLSSNGCLCPA